MHSAQLQNFMRLFLNFPYFSNVFCTKSKYFPYFPSTFLTKNNNIFYQSIYSLITCFN